MDKLKITSGYSVTPTITEIVRECDAAWSRAESIRASGRNDEQTYVELLREFRNLGESYPTIIAAMAAGRYSSKAAKKFLKYVSKHKWETSDEFREIQSTYLVYLDRATTAHPDEAAIRARRQAMIRALEENESRTKKEIEDAQAEADRLNKIRSAQRARDFVARLSTDAPIITDGEVRPVRVIIDI